MSQASFLDLVIEPTVTESSPLILITVPHSLCERPCSMGRTCDCISLLRAKQLTRLLREEGYRVEIFEADDIRRNVDYNRQPARSSAYRERIRNQFPDASLLLDIHSYPKSTTHWSPYSMVFLYNDKPYPQFLWDLVQITRAPLFQGERNDIIQEATDNGLPAVLIEFNANWEDQRDINIDLRNIVKWVNKSVRT